MAKEKEQIDKLKFEREEEAKGHFLIAGVDEVGRGPLAGPVCVACVMMPLDDIIEGVDDSKKISEKKRELLAEQIKEKAICYTVEMVDEETIDKINILEATKLAMKRSIEKMTIKPDVVLVDAISKLDVNTNIRGIIKGDALSYSIGCASILAKVTRDRLMTELAKEYPVYGFEKHKGYGTKAHIEAIKEHGPCVYHRLSFLKFLDK
ncbi:MAG: ribonuclease HII [Clostridiales bacterium]|nr:ribonuclease HII [Clostridiales bacterium]